MLYNVLLVSDVHQHESVPGIHVPALLGLPPTPHPIPPLWAVTERQVELPELHSSFPLAVYFTYARVHAKLLQPCPTLCDPVYSSPPGSSVHRIV